MIFFTTEQYKEFDSDYKLQYDKQFTIHSTDIHSCYGRYANDPIKNTLVNARLTNRNNVVEVRATKSIKAGKEIFISYGDDYWKSKQLFKLPINLQKLILRRNDSEYKDYISNLQTLVLIDM